MQTWCVIATGQSLTKDDVEYVKKRREDGILAGVAAISDAGLNMAEWADILVSHDSAWWKAHPEAFSFKGEKYARHPHAGVNSYTPPYLNGCNSGLMGMLIAKDVKKADKIILLGFDMHGTHYFGPHENGLKNTTDQRFKDHMVQFKRWHGPEVINCTPGSALTFFARKELRVTI